jgi:hypothetical protein
VVAKAAHCVAQAPWTNDPPASVSQVQELEVCVTTPDWVIWFLLLSFFYENVAYGDKGIGT